MTLAEMKNAPAAGCHRPEGEDPNTNHHEGERVMTIFDQCAVESNPTAEVTR